MVYGRRTKKKGGMYAGNPPLQSEAESAAHARGREHGDLAVGCREMKNDEAAAFSRLGCKRGTKARPCRQGVRGRGLGESGREVGGRDRKVPLLLLARRRE